MHAKIAWFHSFILLAALVGGIPLRAQPRLYSQETKNFKVIYYSPSHEYLAPLLIRSLENSLRFYTNTFGYKPTGQITVLIHDFEDSGNGAAGTVPANFIQIGIAPFSYIFDTFPVTERIAILSSHELGHIVTSDKSTARDRAFRSLFRGKIAPTTDDPISLAFSFLASPRQYSPRWFHEGTASFLETWMGGGFGRALGGYDEMVFRALVRDERYIYEYIGLESEGTAADFQGGANSYLYGTRFVNHVAKKYGPQKLIEWITRQEGSRAYFESEFRRVYGTSLRQEWRDWIAGERAWQKVNLATIRQYPVTNPTPISDKPLGSVSRAFYDSATGLILFAVKHPGKMAYLAALHPDTGKIDPLQNVEGAATYFVTSLAFDSAGRKLFFSTNNNDLRGLSVYDLDTRHTKVLAKGLRTGDLAFNTADNSLWGIRKDGGLISIVRLEAPYRDGKILYTFPFATDFSDIEVSADGEYVTGLLVNETAKQNLVRFRTKDLRQGIAQSQSLYDFGYNTAGRFATSVDGKYMYGSTYTTGVSNLFRLDLSSSKLEALSNTETGLFQPLPLPDGSLMALEYRADGLLPVRLPVKVLEDVNAISYLGQTVVEKYPDLKLWKLPSRSLINDLDLRTAAGEYNPLRRMQLVSLYPIIQGYKNSVAGGIRFNFSDSLGLSSATMTTSFSPDSSLPFKERFHGAIEAHYWNYNLSGYFNNADFYDLFGPTKVGRRGFGLKGDRLKTLISEGDRKLDLKVSLAGYAGLDRLPDYQNIVASHPRYLSGTTRLHYSHLLKTIGAIEEEKGSAWDLNARLNYTAPGMFPMVWADYDRGFLTPFRNSSVWVRSSAGKAFGNSGDPFASFYFGGFGNNWVDKANFSRYREFYSFPGTELNALGGRDFAKSMIEWDLPPVRFRSAGTTALYFNWARLALFSGVLGTNLTDSASRAVYTDAGAQLDFRLVWATYMKSTFSVGFAEVRGNNGHISTEKMISLKLN